MSNGTLNISPDGDWGALTVGRLNLSDVALTNPPAVAGRRSASRMSGFWCGRDPLARRKIVCRPSWRQSTPPSTLA
jgi:hypothetical protein